MDSPAPLPHAAAPSAPAMADSPLIGARVVSLTADPPSGAPATQACPRCGGANDAGMRFCKYCGTSLVRAERPTLASPQAIPVPAPIEPPPALLPVPPPADVSPPSVAVASARVPPAAAIEPLARLVTIASDGTEGTAFSLTADQVDLGRQEGAILLPDDPYVSPRHARFVRNANDGGWLVRDLGSVNGVFLRLRAPKPLIDCDLLLLGLQVLRFESVTSAEQGLGPATEHGTLLFGSPALRRHARLCQRTVEGVTCNVYYLHRDETTIGRESGDVVFTDDPFLSRRHAAIRRDPRVGTFSVEDVGSSNGTYLAIHGEAALVHGDHLRMGQHLFRFELAGGGASIASAQATQHAPDGGGRRGA